MTVAILHANDVSVVLQWDTGVPTVAYWGPTLETFEADALEAAVPPAVLDHSVPIAILAEAGLGHQGLPGVAGRRPDGSDWCPRFTLASTEVTDHQATFHLADAAAELTAEISVNLSGDGALTIGAALTNTGTTPYELDRLGLSVPIAPDATELLTFRGRWTAEFQTERRPLTGRTVIENRRGRTSHQATPAAFFGQPGFGEQRGAVYGFQFAWSGNYHLAAERDSEDRVSFSAAELLLPGEVVLDPGDTYCTPVLIGGCSPDGLNGVSQTFHRFQRARLHHPGIDRPRPVTLNTWEAVYFDHNLDVLQRLADTAAEIGVERFVLDDGWFGGRRDDTAGLGDWWVSDAAWPDGLGPLADHVVGLGMEFGLWFEPEMVNPDSDLFRSHPEWAMVDPGYEPVTGRNQLVLDCGRSEVRDYLFDHIGAVLSAYPISYVKWDMNRDIVQGSGADGRPGTHRHVLGLYELLSRLRDAHPSVEWESCSSGGARTDLGILALAERVWTSDSNDALDRQLIQRGASMLLPPEVMGAHIGPPKSHTTGRRSSLRFRAATALFGHMGIEWNVLEATPAQRAALTATIELHKRLRPLLHGGDVVRLDTADPSTLAHGVVALDQRHAVFAFVQLHTRPGTTSIPLRLHGLNPAATYHVAAIGGFHTGAILARSSPTWIANGIALTGAQLMQSGLSMPVLHPESTLLLELTAT